MKTDFLLISSQKRVIKGEWRVGLVIPFQVRFFTTLATVKLDILMYHTYLLVTFHQSHKFFPNYVSDKKH